MTKKQQILNIDNKHCTLNTNLRVRSNSRYGIE